MCCLIYLNLTYAVRKIVLMNHKAQKLLGTGIQTWGQLKLACPSFVTEVETIGPDGNKFTEFSTGKGNRKISLNVNTIPLPDEKIRVITMEDIQSQVELKESDAWLKLIRILMHEMMNSVTPLTSLTETIVQILRNKIPDETQLADISEEDMDDIKFCLENIQNRKNHLQTFIENYHRLTRLHHGSIRVQSEVGEGSCFSLWFEKLIPDNAGKKQ